MIQALSLIQLSLAMKSREKKIIESYKNPREKLKNTKLYTNLSLFSDQFLLAGEGGVFIAWERTFESQVCWRKI